MLPYKEAMTRHHSITARESVERLFGGIFCAIGLMFVAAGCDGRRSPAVGRETATATEMTTKTGIPMVLIPAGEFLMGAAAGADDEKPVHKVRVDAFYMDKYEVAQKSYEALMGTNPSIRKASGYPVEEVSWYNAVTYCNRRSLAEGLEPCYDSRGATCNFGAGGYRLPTEAEWEYACRAGTTTRWAFGDNQKDVAQYGWTKNNAAGTVHPVGQKKPNAWGLYDLHGNVWEWCNDVYGKEYYSKKQDVNPRGPESGSERVLRGGSWRSSADASRSACRSSNPPNFSDACFDVDLLGFRCVRKTMDEKIKEGKDTK